MEESVYTFTFPLLLNIEIGSQIRVTAAYCNFYIAHGSNHFTSVKVNLNASVQFRNFRTSDIKNIIAYRYVSDIGKILLAE